MEIWFNVKKIVETWLFNNEYDGLYCRNFPCKGCQRDNLMACGEACADCLPGYLHKNPENVNDWHIDSIKQVQG